MTACSTYFARRVLQAAKRRIVNRLGVISDQKFYLDSAIVRPRSDVERIMLHSEATDVEFLLPVDGSRVRNSYRPRFVYGVSHATIDPISNLVYDSAGQFIAESSSWLALRQLYSWPQPQVKVKSSVLRGEYIFLPSNSYYHWLIEDLPVFLRSLTVAPRVRVLLARNAASYVREITELIANEVVVIDSPVRVERLVLTAKTAGLGSPFASLTPHPADVAMLRTFFSERLKPTPPAHRIYLSRIGKLRSPANERALLREMQMLGYTIFDGTATSVRAQIALFSSATKLVGIHGAALANIVWAPDGIHVCEIFSSEYLPGCYSALAAIRNGYYSRMLYAPGPRNEIDSVTFGQIVAAAGQE